MKIKWCSAVFVLSLVLCTGGGAQFVVKNATTEFMRVSKTSGNVAIGLNGTTAEARLDVDGTIRFRSLVKGSINNPVLTVDADGDVSVTDDQTEDDQPLNDVLIDGNNAQGQEAVNFGRVGIGTASPGASLEVIGSSVRGYPFDFPDGSGQANAGIFSQDLTPGENSDIKLLNIQSNVPHMNYLSGTNAYRVGVASHLVRSGQYTLASSMTTQDTYKNEAAGIVGKVFGPASAWSGWGLVSGGLFETFSEDDEDIYALVVKGDAEFRGSEAAVTFSNKDGYTSGSLNFDGLIYFGEPGSYNIGKNVGTTPNELQIAAGGGNINLVASNILFNSTVLHASDRRFKNNIQPLQIDPQALLKLQSVRFNWKNPQNSEQVQAGFIAQDVETVLPELVYTDKNEGYKYVNYTGMIPYLFKILQEQQKRIEQLEKEQ